MFPIIKHISDVLPHITGREEFVVAERDWGTVIDYNYVTPDTFANEYVLECRGVKFDRQGNIIARPLHKFMNIGEKEHTQEHVLPWQEPHMVLEKLDGSMIHPVIVNGEMLWMTRMGVTDVALEAAKRVTPAIKQFSEHFIEYGVTPIFEWVSPLNRIVVPYTDDRLVLIAMRDMHSGAYRNYEEMRACISVFGGGVIPLVQAWSENVTDVSGFISHTRGLQDQEGYVVRWQDGHMVKMKADAYVLMHKTKDALTWEKDVIRLCLENKVDDALPLLSADDATLLADYDSNLRRVLRLNAELIEAVVAQSKFNLGGEKKRFALEVVPKIDRIMQPVAYRTWDGAVAYDELSQTFLRHTGTRTEVEKLRPIMGGLSWNRKVVMESA